MVGVIRAALENIASREKSPGSPVVEVAGMGLCLTRLISYREYIIS